MAFYSTSVDENGNEIERRHSARSLTLSLSTSSTSTNTSRVNLSSRSSETRSSVRFVNPAAFIEKTPDNSETASLNEEHKTQAPSEIHSDIVPPLDLQSEDNYPTRRDFTFSYRDHCDAAKIVLKPDRAFETWLSAKKKTLTREADKRRLMEEQKQREQEERKHLAEQKFQQWLEAKEKQSREREKVRMPAEQEERPKQKAHIKEEEAQARLEAWERAKREEEERRRAQKREEEARRRKMEEERSALAEEAWKKWLAQVDKKPRPVPLNRGIFTLRGTISDIFVNPNEWQSTFPIEEE